MRIKRTKIPLGQPGVYAILCLAKSRVYVGATGRTFRARLAQHRGDLKRGDHANARLQADWTHGLPSHFVFVPLEVVEDRLGRAVREGWWMHDFKWRFYDLYNVRPAPWR